MLKKIIVIVALMLQGMCICAETSNDAFNKFALALKNVAGKESEHIKPKVPLRPLVKRALDALDTISELKNEKGLRQALETLTSSKMEATATQKWNAIEAKYKDFKFPALPKDFIARYNDLKFINDAVQICPNQIEIKEQLNNALKTITSIVEMKLDRAALEKKILDISKQMEMLLSYKIKVLFGDKKMIDAAKDLKTGDQKFKDAVCKGFASYITDIRVRTAEAGYIKNHYPEWEKKWTKEALAQAELQEIIDDALVAFVGQGLALETAYKNYITELIARIPEVAQRKKQQAVFDIIVELRNRYAPYIEIFQKAQIVKMKEFAAQNPHLLVQAQKTNEFLRDKLVGIRKEINTAVENIGKSTVISNSLKDRLIESIEETVKLFKTGQDVSLDSDTESENEED